MVCRELGLMGGMAHSNSYYGQGSGQIWLKDVGCSGSETSLGDCVGGNVFSSQINDCFHYEDASVTCTGRKSLFSSFIRCFNLVCCFVYLETFV